MKKVIKDKINYQTTLDKHLRNLETTLKCGHITHAILITSKSSDEAERRILVEERDTIEDRKSVV
jgi:hypothetical protein